MKKKINRIFAIFALVGALVFTTLAAPAPYSLFGDAQLSSPGNNSPTAASLTTVGTNSYSGVDFNIPSGLTFADIEKLSTDYKITMGDCGSGSPRFQVNVLDPNTGTEKNIFVYVGPAPNYSGCTTQDWVTTGDLLESANLIDTSQIGGGFYQSYADAEAAFGSYEVTGIQIVADGPNQTILVDNVMINNTTFTFESASSCKNGGWQSFSTAPGPFTNQGQCVSYFARGGQ
jgi:hypothetical protein